MNFGKSEAKLFPLGENMLMPCEPSVQVEAEVFTSSDWGSCTWLRWTGGQVARRVVKVTWVDLVSLAFSRQVLSQA
jgi:hypothetical protein